MRNARARLAGLALAGLVLSGCGASIGIHPGSAAVVGDESLSMSKIDSTATLYCTAYLPQIKQSSTSLVPMRLIRQYVAASLSQRLLGEQLASQYDVQPVSQYAQRVDQIEQQFAAADPAAKNAVVDVEAGAAYLQTVQIAVGAKLLAASGQPVGSLKAQLQRGEVATQDWITAHPIRLDPVFGVSIDGGLFKPATDQTSYPLSALASQGASASGSSPNAEYAGALPPSQVCG